MGAESARSSANIAIFSTKGVGSVGRGREASGSVLQWKSGVFRVSGGLSREVSLKKLELDISEFSAENSITSKSKLATVGSLTCRPSEFAFGSVTTKSVDKSFPRSGGGAETESDCLSSFLIVTSFSALVSTLGER